MYLGLAAALAAWYNSVSVQEDNTVDEGLICPASTLLSFRVRLCTRQSSALRQDKLSPSRLEDLSYRKFGRYQGRR